MLIGLKDNKDKQSLMVYEGEIVPHIGGNGIFST